MFSFVLWLEYLKESSIIPEFIFLEVLENKNFLSSLPKKKLMSFFFIYLFDHRIKPWRFPGDFLNSLSVNIAIAIAIVKCYSTNMVYHAVYHSTMGPY